MCVSSAQETRPKRRFPEVRKTFKVLSTPYPSTKLCKLRSQAVSIDLTCECFKQYTSYNFFKILHKARGHKCNWAVEKWNWEYFMHLKLLSPPGSSLKIVRKTGPLSAHFHVLLLKDVWSLVKYHFSGEYSATNCVIWDLYLITTQRNFEMADEKVRTSLCGVPTGPQDSDFVWSDLPITGRSPPTRRAGRRCDVKLAPSWNMPWLPGSPWGVSVAAFGQMPRVLPQKGDNFSFLLAQILRVRASSGHDSRKESAKPQGVTW